MKMEVSYGEHVELERVADRQVPINVVMGELGSGKTTVILGLVKQIAGPDYRVVWLKNEYGDINVDGFLAREQGIQTREIMNGCLCCTAIGSIEGAVKQILAMRPDRIIIETAGIAHPAPIAMELKRFPDVVIDSFIEVIDAVNFAGFSDRSLVGQSYGKYIDFIVINKVNLVDERRLDDVIDRINDNFGGTPKIRTSDGVVPAELVFGADRKSAAGGLSVGQLRADASVERSHVEMRSFSVKWEARVDKSGLEDMIKSLPIDDIYRAKGVVLTADDGWQVVNGVAGRVTWQPLSLSPERNEILFIGPSATEHEGAVRKKLGLVA